MISYILCKPKHFFVFLFPFEEELKFFGVYPCIVVVVNKNNLVQFARINLMIFIHYSLISLLKVEDRYVSVTLNFPNC